MNVFNFKQKNAVASKLPFRIGLLYLLTGLIWLIFTYIVKLLLGEDTLKFFLVNIPKGLIFIFVTSLLFYFLLKKFFISVNESTLKILSKDNEYKTLTENLEYSVIRQDLDCRYLYINKAAWETLKSLLVIQKADEIIGLTPEEAFKNPEHAKIVRKEINYVISIGKVFKQKTKSGDKHISYSIIPEIDGTGKIVSVISLITDETEMMENMLKLEESEKFNRYLLNQSSIIFFVTDLVNPENFYINDSIKNLLGYSDEDVKEKGYALILQILHPDDLEKFTENTNYVINYLKDNEVFEYDYRMRHKNGASYVLHVNFRIYQRNEQGNAVKLMGTAVDITKLKHTEEILVAKTSYLNAIIDASPLSIFDLDNNGRIKSVWNRASEKMFGWRSEDVVGRELPIVPIERYNEFRENLDISLSNNFINGKEQIRKRIDGSDINIRIHSRPVAGKNGDVETILAFNEDITLEKKLQGINQKNEEYLNLLYETGLVANNTYNTKELFLKCFNSLFKMIDVNCIMISSITDDGDFIKCDAINFNGNDVNPSELPLLKIKKDGGGIQSKVIMTGKSLVINNETEKEKNKNINSTFVDYNGNICSLEDGIESEVPKSSIFIPLKIQDKVIGVLQLQSFKTDNYNENDILKIEPFAFILASGINKTKLYSKLQEELNNKIAALEQVRKFSIGIEQSPNSIIITNNKYEIEYVNPYFTELTGYSSDEVMGKNPNILQSGQTKFDVYQSLWDTLDMKKIWNGEFLNRKKNGELYWEAASIGPIMDSSGNVTHFIAIKQDITEKKKQDKELKDSLEEKEIMLKEIHHRVKNNLQVISSLLNMQIGQYEHPEAIEAVNSSRNRVKAMALVHESLYKSKNIGKTSLKDYILMLANNIYSTYGITFERVNLKIETDDTEFTLDTIIPLGLILNEAISNSLKHGFNDNRNGEIVITLSKVVNDITKPEYFIISIKDNGIGLPHGFEPANCNSLGITLLTSLAAQLDGEFEMKNHSGTEVIIVFKELKYKERV